MKAIDLSLKAVEEFESRNFTCALELFERCKALQVADAFKIGMYIAEPEEAITLLEKAIGLEGDIEEVHFNLALAHRGNRAYEACIHHIDEALKIDPGYHQAKKLRGDIERALIVTRAEKDARENGGNQ